MVCSHLAGDQPLQQRRVEGDRATDMGDEVKPGIGALDWRKVAKLVPNNPQVKGARPRKFEGEN